MRNTTIKGFLYAALSSSTFGLAPFFSISLLIAGFSSFEVLTYRWGIASLILAIAGIILGEQFRISRKDWQTVFILSLFRATTSFSLVIAYQNIASGVASTIHFMYPLAVAVTMMLFFKEKKSFSILFAVFISLIGATLLSTGEIDFEGGDTTTGLVAAAISIFSYGGYIIGVRKSRAVNIPSTALTCYVMGLGTVPVLGGVILGVRFIVYTCMGSGTGHVQSLILASMLIIIGVLVWVLGLMGDIIASNRKLLEDIQYHVRKLDYDSEKNES